MPKKFKPASGSVVSSPLSPNNLAALRRCRALLVKDLDIDELLRNTASFVDSGGTNSDGVGCGSRWIGPEVRSSVLSVPDAERRAIALLDAIESPPSGGTTTGRVDADAAFAAFLDALRNGERNRKLYAVLEETLRVLSFEQNGSDDDGDGDECGLFVDRTSVPGDSVRRLLRRYTARQSASLPTTSGESKSDLRSPDATEPTGGDDYVDCFTVATRGSRLQPEPWIKHAKASYGADSAVHSSTSSSSSSSSPSAADNTVVITKDLVFRRIARSSLSSFNQVALKLPPPLFNSVYVVDFDYKFAAPSAEAEVGRREILPPPRLQPVAPPGAATVLSTAGGEADGDRPSSKKTTNDIFLTTELNLTAPIPTPPLPPKPRDLPVGDLYRSANKSACRPLPLPAVDQVVNGHDTPSSSMEAPPLPDRKVRTGAPTDLKSDAVDVQMSTVSLRTEETKFSSSPVLPVRRRDANTDVAEATESGTESDASEPHPPPQLPPRSFAVGSRPLPLPPVQSCTAESTDGDKGQSVEADDGKSNVNLAGEELTIAAAADADVKAASIAEVATAQSLSVDEATTSDRCPTAFTSSATTTATSDSTSLADSDDTVDGHSINRPISQREDSGIVVTVSTSSPTIVSCDDSSARSSTTDVFVQHHNSHDEHTLACNDETAVSECVTTSNTRLVTDPMDVGSAASDSTPDGGNSSSGSAETTTIATVGRDSGVDSLLSLPRQQERRNSASGEEANSVNGYDGDDVVCDEDDLSEIRIPAGEDCPDDDDLDRFSSESSHYEDIEQLAMENVYLDPRRPSDSAASSLTAGRTPSSMKRRRNDALGGSGRYSYAYGRMATPALSRRREEMLTELEATGRKLLSAGTTLILDHQEADFVDRLTTPVEPQSNSAETETDAVSGVDGCSARCFRDVRLVYDARCQAFYVPSDSLRSHGDPTGQRWFYPVSMTPRDATLFLRSENQPGCFVVYRPPTTSGAARQQAPASGPLFYLSVGLGNGDVVHYRIDRNPRGDVSIAGHDHSFLSVVDLVNYFRRNRSGLAVRLGRPLADARRAGVDPSLLSVATRQALNRRDLTVTSRVVRFRPTHDDFEAAPTNAEITDGGRFGKTFIGCYRGKFVAVSVMGRQNFTDGFVESCGGCFHSSHVASQIDEFLEPALDVVAGLRHDNVARLIGISCTERPYYVVWEYTEGGGTLADRLRESGVKRLAYDDVDSLFDLCLQASSAVAYLESQRFVVHRDIAARSFFVVEGREIGIGGGPRLIKLANFDRARKVIDDDYQAPLSETVFVRWAAPEVLVESRYSTKSDVWSLGIVFWEVFSGASVPYSAFESLEQVAVHVASASGGRLDRPTGPCPDDLWTVMRSCWRHRPADRPSPAAVYDRLRNGRSKIYAGLASLGDVLPSDGWKMSNGGVRNPAAAATGVPQSSAAIAAPVVVDRRNLPLPLEPKTGRSPIKPENGFSGSFLVQCPDLPPPHSAAKDRSASSSTAVDKQSATREKRWSGGNGSKVQQGPLSTCVTPTQSQQTSLLPSSPSWETASVASVAVMGSHERSNRLRHSFMNRFFSGNHRKHKKVPSLSAVPAATAEVDKRL